ncbi:MAG: response regulator [Candidatus Omnitrophica bacterium]|nr:response regulator [Candidatus Omnitrophota bacterium]
MVRPRILVADDEEGIRESLRLILGEHYDVVFAGDGEETLSQLTRERFEVALLDIKMPKLDGLEVMKRIKQQQIATPVLVLTAYQSVELAKEAVKLGARDYLPKPFERDHILQAVRGILSEAGSKTPAAPVAKKQA